MAICLPPAALMLALHFSAAGPTLANRKERLILRREVV
jgi:hypothetical protein